MSYTSTPTIQRTFKVSACVDWIELTVNTRQLTQFRHLQRALRLILDLPESAREIRVEPINAGAGNAADRFTIRLHDEPANSYHELSRIMAALDHKFPFASEPEISGIEIALDFYKRTQSTAGLREMTHRLMTSIAAHGEGRGKARQYDPTINPTGKKKSLAMRYLEDGHRIDPGLMLYIGDGGDPKLGIKRDPVTHQVYFKTVDRNREAIASDDFRARAEFTLTGAALKKHNLSYLSGLDGYRFQRLAGLLHFRVLKSLEAITRGKNIFFKATVEHYWDRTSGSVTAFPVGWLKYERYTDGKPRHGGHSKVVKHHRHSVADEELNALVRKKFAELSKVFST
ncbi:hypothetical protein [Glaciimonas soli]|uniref:Uncharacterized protein n=1 Tax=Glaciimonas soli TaxID=2590999 RepID=A0A843YWV1_9BURK|nr:hypothetical protein [Glaciimonas soli]MQR02467.1 hypothetical protein [Glaciimonas soli]